MRETFIYLNGLILQYFAFNHLKIKYLAFVCGILPIFLFVYTEYQFLHKKQIFHMVTNTYSNVAKTLNRMGTSTCYRTEMGAILTLLTGCGIWRLKKSPKTVSFPFSAFIMQISGKGGMQCSALVFPLQNQADASCKVTSRQKVSRQSRTQFAARISLD